MYKVRNRGPVTLKDMVGNSDEERSYYSLYGDLYFKVPHYVKSVEFLEDGIQVKYKCGVTYGLYKNAEWIIDHV